MALEYQPLSKDNLPGIGMKDNFKMVVGMVREFTILLKGIGMKDSSFLMPQTGKECIIGQMGTGKKENSKTKIEMGELFFISVMEEQSIEFMKMERY